MGLNTKKYIERRNTILADLETMLDACETETRALNEEERTKYDAWMKEIREIDNMLQVEERHAAWKP